jgi:hypothetical protein
MDAEQYRVAVAEMTGKIAPTNSGGELVVEAMNPTEANEAVIREVSSWEGVSVHEHRFGGVEFRFGRRELGHLHPRFADLPFPRRVRDALIAAGRARPHHVLPDSGWVTVPMRTSVEVGSVIELFRENYKRAVRARG